MIHVSTIDPLLPKETLKQKESKTYYLRYINDSVRYSYSDVSMYPYCGPTPDDLVRGVSLFWIELLSYYVNDILIY